jgi:transcriptional regulator with XRE-family HTH domain
VSLHARNGCGQPGGGYNRSSEKGASTAVSGLSPTVTKTDDKMYSSVDNDQFSDWLNEELKKREWTQADLARASGLTRQAISNYINERRNPDDQAIAAIARALRLPPETVFRIAGLDKSLPPILEELLHAQGQAGMAEAPAQANHLRGG